jgi:hypothetical protein
MFDMQGWMLLWKILFIAGLVLFAGLALWVIFAGARDIKKLFLKLDRNHSEKAEQNVRSIQK